MVIYRELIKDKNHPSAEDVYDKVSEHIPTISADTVYRTINTFEQYGLIQRVHVQDDRSRFDPKLKKHHHLICKRCKSIVDFDWQTFDQLTLPKNVQSWGAINSKHVEFRGLCKKCIK